MSGYRPFLSFLLLRFDERFDRVQAHEDVCQWDSEEEIVS